jgi:calcium-dependent protein kinase
MGTADDQPSSLAREISSPLGAASIPAFAGFYRSAKLRRVALTALASQWTDDQTVGGFGDLRRQFLLADVDGNGKISRDELVQLLEKNPPDGIEDVPTWVATFFDSVDADGSGELEFTEWMAAAVSDCQFRSEEAVRAAFRVFDLDGDGVISKWELGQVLHESLEEVGLMLPEYDLDGSGDLNLEEFKALLTGVVQSPTGRSCTPGYASARRIELTAS